MAGAPSDLLAFVLALALDAAHVDTESVATLELAPDAVRLSLVVDADRLMEVCGAPPPRGDDWSAGEVAAVGARATEYVRANWRLRARGGPAAGSQLELAAEGVVPVATPAIRRVELRFRLPPLRDVEVELTHSLFDLLEPSHHHFVVLTDGAATLADFEVVGSIPCRFFVPDAGAGATVRRLRARALAGAAAALRAPWLLAFLLALMAAPLPARERAASVAAALGAVVLALVVTRARLVAPAPWAALAAAAFACVYVAVENRRARAVRLRVATALLFGLVHGMALEFEVAGGGRIATTAGDAVFAIAKLAAAAALALGVALAVRRLRRAAVVLNGAAFTTGLVGVGLALSSQIRP